MTGRKTIICDIDGTIFEYTTGVHELHLREPKLLPGVREAFSFWDRYNYRIVLMTGRREGVRKHTEQQLAKAGIFYDVLVMGVGNGSRILINDFEDTVEPTDTAFAINVKRNSGLPVMENEDENSL